LLLALVLAQPLLTAQHSPLLGQYLGGLARLGDRIGELPQILFGLAEHALRPNRFGLSFAVLPITLLVARRSAVVPLFSWLGLGFVAIVAAFLLSPEPDVQHHLKSSAPRLLSHWLGVIWLCAGCVPYPVQTTPASERDRA
jgi:hypothetical protein